MTQKKLDQVLRGALAVLVFAAQAACAEHAAEPRPAAAQLPSTQAAPADLARYQVRLFELIDKYRDRYDAAFTRQLRTLLAPQLKRQKNFLDRMTSGPTAAGRVVKVGQRSYVYYGICQAHQCATTTMDLLYEPAGRRLVGKLLDQCAPQWLGQPDSEEMAVLNASHQDSYPATADACAGK